MATEKQVMDTEKVKDTAKEVVADKEVVVAVDTAKEVVTDKEVVEEADMAMGTMMDKIEPGN